MFKKISNFGPIFIIFAATVWSFDALLRVSLYTLAPITIVFWEHLLGALLISPIVWAKRKEFKLLSPREWMAVVFLALFPSTLGTLFYTAALSQVNYIPFSVVVLLQQLQPIWAILTAAILLKEKIQKNFVIWAGLALISAYLISFRDLNVNFASSSQSMPALLGLLAGVFWGSGTAVGKYVLNKLSFVVTTFLRFSGAAVFSLLIIYLQGLNNQFASINQMQWQAIITIVLVTGTTAFLIYYYGLKRTPAKIATICELAWPGSALLIDIFLFKKDFSSTQILGIILLLISIYNVSGAQKVKFIAEKE